MQIRQNSSKNFQIFILRVFVHILLHLSKHEVLLPLTVGSLVIAFVTIEAGAAQPGEPPPEDLLGPYVVPVATALAAAAFLIRGFLHGKADAAAGEERRRLRFRATFLPLVLLEGGALFGLIAWLQARKEQPGLIAALVLLAGMLAIIPLQDRDEAAR